MGRFQGGEPAVPFSMHDIPARSHAYGGNGGKEERVQGEGLKEKKLHAFLDSYRWP